MLPSTHSYFYSTFVNLTPNFTLNCGPEGEKKNATVCVQSKKTMPSGKFTLAISCIKRISAGRRHRNQTECQMHHEMMKRGKYFVF